ncbi:MAG: glycosyltransferase family 2 protein [Parcubacteria group bacterium CG10_big_fil_rev_8_21_14_0_10_36_14]|nr:MAG: glycosyltransferase family 2 protein [Parcubacteria group bacterium CG10_big_fil_rev_8_21_14_0_10_36_14]
MQTFVIIPAYNEASVIADTIRDVQKFYKDIVVVDDGSKDKTSKIAEIAGVKVLRHILNRGQGAALRTGINYALKQGADVVVTYDADGQFEAEEISRLCHPVINGKCDVVLGSRFLSGNRIPLFKKIILKSAILFTRAITGLRLTDTHNGFRIMNRKAAEQIKIRQDRMAHASEIVHEIARLKLSYKELPITVKYTIYSKRKGQRLSGAFHILFDLIFK